MEQARKQKKIDTSLITANEKSKDLWRYANPGHKCWGLAYDNGKELMTDIQPEGTCPSGQKIAS